jgi:hypothetical protein
MEWRTQRIKNLRDALPSERIRFGSCGRDKGYVEYALKNISAM